MTLPRLKALSNQWEHDPPLYMAVNRIRRIIQAYFKIEDPKPAPKTEKEVEQSESEFLESFTSAASLFG